MNCDWLSCWWDHYCSNILINVSCTIQEYALPMKIKVCCCSNLVFRAMCNMLFKIQSTFECSLLCFHKTGCKKLSCMTNLDGFAYKFVVKDHVLEHILYLIAYFKELSGATINTCLFDFLSILLLFAVFIFFILTFYDFCVLNLILWHFVLIFSELTVS